MCEKGSDPGGNLNIVKVTLEEKQDLEEKKTTQAEVRAGVKIRGYVYIELSRGAYNIICHDMYTSPCYYYE